MAVTEDAKAVKLESDLSMDTEMHILEIASRHKPVGVNKYFQMLCICEELEDILGKAVSSDIIWAYLETLYDLSSLDENESLPFPNNEEDYCLPESEFSELIAEKLAEVSEAEQGSVTKGSKDYSRSNKSSAKERGSTPVPDKSSLETEPSSQSRGKGRSKRVSTTSTAKAKDKRLDKESSPANSTSSKKADDEPLLSVTKGKSAAKRSLRSRPDDDVASNKSITPPPKRPRRI